jgi:hypothetical protein
VILTVAVAAGWAAGWGWARWRRQPYRPPEFCCLWLVFAAFLPQFVVIYLPSARFSPDWLTVVLLTASQTAFLGFVWLNRRAAGAFFLLCGVILNLSVMTANGGFMPISPQTASRLVTEEKRQSLQIEERFGAKDRLLLPQDTRLEWLADRFLTPPWVPYRAAFSLGDIFIAFGVFWALAKPQTITESV